jgi:hypothetical protein
MVENDWKKTFVKMVLESVTSMKKNNSYVKDKKKYGEIDNIHVGKSV